MTFFVLCLYVIFGSMALFMLCAAIAAVLLMVDEVQQRVGIHLPGSPEAKEGEMEW